MVKKAHMGSDPFQKKDPLGWIGSDSQDGAAKAGGEPVPPSNPRRQSKAGNSSKQQLPSPQNTPDQPEERGEALRGSTTSKGLRPGWTRATFIVRIDSLQKLKRAAYWERKELKRVLDEALTVYLLKKDLPAIPEDDLQSIT